MAADIYSLRVMVQTYLMDTLGLVWEGEVLDEAIRQALRDIQLVSTTKLTINGLDEADITILEDNMASLLVRGAAAYAVEMRTVDRADVFELSQTGLEMSKWAANQKAMFWTEVEKLRLSQFQKSANAPYFTIPDPDEII